MLNATSVTKANAFEQIVTDVNSISADIIVLTEKWMKEKHADDAFTISGYICLRKDRVKRLGGGVAAFVKLDLQRTRINVQSTMQHTEDLWFAVTRIVNTTVSRGVVLAAWRTAVITPVPKCTLVSGVSYLPPISVTIILSRMFERLIVKDHIFPAITPAELYDQFGFKPTGSTTAALVDITNTISIMLDTNKYVLCLPINFSKAFDSADHLISRKAGNQGAG